MDVLERGRGRLFTDPDPDKARGFFRKKSRRLENKLTSVKEAVEKFTKDGDYLVIGGFGTNRTPFAVCHEIVRQKRKNMGFAGHTSTHDFQILAAGRVFNRVDAAYIVGLEARGLSKISRQYMESGDVEVSEWTNYSLSARFKAAAMGVSFVPARNMMGTDTFKYSGSIKVNCPYTGTPYVLMPALFPDASAIHVHEADIYGNCRIKGISVSDLDVARASKHLIVTAERIVPTEKFRDDPTHTSIPYYLVDAVCEVPYGAFPGNMHEEYFSDEDHLKQWLDLEKNPDDFQEFFDENIFNCQNHFDYIQRNGGMEKMMVLKRKELICPNPENANGAK